MTKDERRSAHLLFGEELALGQTTPEAVAAAPEVLDAVRSLAVPSTLSRGLQRVQVKRGRLGYLDASVAPMVRAREAVLGDAAAGPPRFLVRMDEFPHWLAGEEPTRYGTAGFARFDRIMREAGVPYLLAVVPRVPRNPMDPEGREWRPHDYEERELLEALGEQEGMAFGVHGLDHRTRDTNPRKHSELSGRKRDDLLARLDAADAVLRVAGLPTDVFVAPYNRFDARQYGQLAARYDVVTGGPESIACLGFHRTPLWRGDAVYLPSYPPLYGRASEVLPAVRALQEQQAALWIPLTLHWGWEQDDGWSALEELAAALAGTARPWDEFLSGVRASKAAA